MNRRILVTGLTSLHWGRLEYGNVGNYYIIVPLFRQLHKAFPNADILTTLQLSDTFSKKEEVTVLPLDYYYSWSERDLSNALEDYALAELYKQTNVLASDSKFIELVLSCDLVVSVAGDMWGDNSESIGKDRFMVELLRTRAAQLIGKPVVLAFSSPGPVTNANEIALAQKVYGDYALVINRENMSKPLLAQQGFDISKTESFACPAFLFDASCYPEDIDIDELSRNEHFNFDGRLNVGVVVSTYSIADSSFDQWDRDNSALTPYAEMIESLVNHRACNAILFSHSNGFEIPPNFKRIHWRDYRLTTQIYEYVQMRGIADMQYVHKIDTLYNPWELHGLIGKMNLLITGRVHAAAASLSQCVPTVAFEYKNGPLSHKMLGFMELAGQEEYVIRREDFDFMRIVNNCIDSLPRIRKHLQTSIPAIKKRVAEAFGTLISAAGIADE